MKILLLADVKGIGRKMDIVSTKDGFARNFLIPQGLAKIMNEEMAHIKTIHEKHISSDKDRYESYVKKLSHEKIDFFLKTGKKGEVFESVNKDRVESELEKRGYVNATVEMKPIKKIGKHTITISFPHTIKTMIEIEIKEQI